MILEGGNVLDIVAMTQDPMVPQQDQKVLELEDRQQKILNRIPPIWEDAEKYGKANLAYDPSKCTLNYSPDSEKFCHACHLYVPEEDDFYSLWDNLILGELGEGFPITF